MRLSDEQWLFLLDVAKLIQYAELRGYKLTAGELYRPAEMQEIYYKQGKSNIKTEGQHGKRLAIDLNVFKHDKLTYEKADIKPLGDYWESLSKQNRWGGNFKSLLDTPHFERLEE
jgi:D-alanyl-D-alanine dipeptidase